MTPDMRTVFDSLPPVDVARRMHGLHKHFGAPSDKPMIPCMNVDRTHVPVIDGIDPGRVVSIHHTIVACMCCNDQMWIGPNQAKIEGTRICYLCMIVLYACTGDSFPEPTMLDPEADKVPRRFS